ncbi:zinc finger CCCH domain-containing protein 3 isoform X1 [Onychostruthus taczanowskii]|uniref:zinc finger CCCH domain-containing protein 3 isoform X1 n=1 Tax=Onychostruthus taczanowskii TaxID=356909 RepID=UPI001B805A69|nr:zinc finger CCCH domain-containing protein 3 isoform X1 [Onychostruthus taczanowskii]
MEERERLCREIRALQGLINSHRNMHGNVPRPAPSAPPRWNNPHQPGYTRRGAFSTRYSQQAPRNFHPRQTHSWRKKYSLDNRLPGSGYDAGSASSNSQGFGSLGNSQTPEAPESSPERHVDFTTDGNIVVDIQVPQRAGQENVGPYGDFSRRGAAVAPSADGNIQKSLLQEEERRPSLSISFSSTSRTVCLPGSGAGSSFSASGSTSESAVALKSEPQKPLEFPGQEPAQHLVQIKAEPLSPGQPSGEDASLHPKLFGNTELLSRPAQAAGVALVKSRFPVIPKAPTLQKAASAPISSKSQKFRKNNYTWVANPGKSSRIVKRWASPRAENSKKGIAGADKGAKISPKADLGAKIKKVGLQSKLGVSPSKYKWKASGLQALPSTSKSAFQWRSEDQRKAPAPSIPRTVCVTPASSAASVVPGGMKSSGEAALSSYKVKSRTKIIKRKGNVGSPTDKKNISPTTALKSRFHLRRRNSMRGKPLVTVKRSSPRGLVQISKHRLCRMPATRTQAATKEGSNSHFIRSPPANKVIKTRYRIVKKNVVSPALSSFTSPIPTWKTRRLVTSRSPLLNQTRPSLQGGKSQLVQQHWRNKGFRCIGGVMYRVSANKLSKTSSSPVRARDLSTKTPIRAALRLHSTPSPGVFTPSLSRSSTCRYIASRAVQRSLAIIRQAKQKKKKKEYCMYYNRFGKCNRGESCPYIHDPEKVAVCTRFLRGTCKKTDGTCPFSHKVSKDKMPVCSYYLKGICSNSNCPYSHVYVSRKAEVCQDFLKGYCPMGEKCKKKHTLVCPDFAKKGVCPKGARCKLLHPHKRRHQQQVVGDGDHNNPPSKWRRIQEASGRNDPAQLQDDGEIPGPSSAEQEVKFWKEEEPKPSSCLQKLPSFISLRSPESPGSLGCKEERDEDEPEDEPGNTKRRRIFPRTSLQDSENSLVGGRGKRLQIKPRL